MSGWAGNRRARGRARGRARRAVTGTAAALAAMAALTASQAPGFVPSRAAHPNDPVARHDTAPVPPSDDAYHTELPPLASPVAPGTAPTPGAGAGVAGGPPVSLGPVQAGIPATVLAAYRRAASAVARTDPGCRLPWELLAAIGKVESGQARGGRVDAHGTTLAPILGPVLDGVGFARITDTDDGVYDGDRTYDRAVGPMQFIPSTWARWGTDGNGDGRADPDNIHDAALAAGHYLCAGNRTLAVRSDLDRAVLSYNHSYAYLRTVLSWLAFYQRGAHPVPDGTGVLPVSPGAGTGVRPGPATPSVPAPAPSPRPGGGIVVGPQPSPRPTLTPRPPSRPSPSPSPSPSPTPTPSPSHPTPTPTPSPTPTPTAPGPSPSPTPTPTPTAPGCPSPTPTASPSPSATQPPDPDSTAPRSYETGSSNCA
ncbi:lytic transglycosylase domain-containing protein [Streptomyces sp. NPDC045431]|uniref:lytic transglycosylase domain-containing protein n=1 Tax=Streptomyces sp. NPDC045431 TaxID=3155613 RepID=UPI0033C9B457